MLAMVRKVRLLLRNEFLKANGTNFHIVQTTIPSRAEESGNATNRPLKVKNKLDNPFTMTPVQPALIGHRDSAGLHYLTVSFPFFEG